MAQPMGDPSSIMIKDVSDGFISIYINRDDTFDVFHVRTRSFLESAKASRSRVDSIKKLFEALPSSQYMRQSFQEASDCELGDSFVDLIYKAFRVAYDTYDCFFSRLT